MKKFIITMATVAFLLTVTVFLKNEYGSIFSGDTYGIPAAIEMGEIDHLFIGSSMFRLGLDIHVLEENLDGTVYILSYNGNQPTFVAKELEYLLAHGVKIKNLYVDFYAFSAASVPRIYDKKIFLDTDLKFKIDVWNQLKKNDDTGWVTFYEMFVTANNEQILLYPIHNKIASAEFHNGGWLVTEEGDTEEHLNTLERTDINDVNVIQEKGYERIVEIAEENQMNILFLETPKYKKLLEETGEACYSKTLDQMKQIAERLEAPYVLSKELEFDHEKGENFSDLVHLSSVGKTNYTKALCDYWRNH